MPCFSTIKKYTDMDINLTPAERAAAYLYIIEGLTDRRTLYNIAFGSEKTKNLNENSLKTMSSNWFNSFRIKNFIKEYKQTQDKQTEILTQEITERVKTETTNQLNQKTQDENINFLDRDEFLQFLNSRANEITDDKLRNDILKMLSDNLRYKDGENDENNEIQRFYTPLLCKDCQLYRNELDKLK